jgi:drug/metabolite transporter (DMT)-like permease
VGNNPASRVRIPPSPLPSERALPGGQPDSATLVAFALLVLVAGGNAPAIRYVSCKGCELDPFWAAAMRFLAAAVIFAVISVALRLGPPRGRGLIASIVFGALQFGAGFGFVYWGLVETPAGLAQILLACIPLFTFGLALAHRQERFRADGLVGAVLAVAGTAVIFSAGVETGVPATSMLAILAGAACLAEALVVVKAFPAVHPVAMNAVSMAVGASILLVLSAVFGEALARPESTTTLASQAYLVLAGSVLVFWLYIVVVQRWTASAASYQLVLIPLVTVVVSAWLQDDPITPAFAAGSVLVLLGVYVGALRRPAMREAPSPQPD